MTNNMMTTEEALIECAADILSDSEWTRRVVATALVAEQHMADRGERDHPVFQLLWDALRDRSRVVR